MSNLNQRAWKSVVILFAVMALAIFISAGTVAYWQGWLYLVVYFGASIAIMVYLMKHDPALLERRMRGGPRAEKQPVQKVAMTFASLAFAALFIVSPLDHRFHWSRVPLFLIFVGDVVVLAAFYFVLRVAKINSYLSATIEIGAGQKVVSTGPYAVVRHPMYAGMSWLFVGTPLALDSFWALFIIAVFLPALIVRLLDEEKLLARDLPGYEEYRKKVRWRMIPGIF